jgi:hypothetical protein
MRKLIPIILALALAACATTSVKNPFGPPSLDAVEAAYGATYALAVGYHDACAARQIPPSCRPIVVKLQKAGQTAQGALVQARDFVDHNPTINPATVIAQATAAVDLFTATAALYGVK